MNSHSSFVKSISFLLFFFTFNITAQELKYKIGAQYLFANYEFISSAHELNYTQSGFNLGPQLGIAWDKNNAVFAGVNLMTLSGTSKIIDKAKFLAYYQYHNDNTDFYAGSFLRAGLFDDYSEFLFNEPIFFLNPTIQGLYYKRGDTTAFFKLFLDWNGFQTEVQRESFFIGASAYKKYDMFFVDFQSYLYHLANIKPRSDKIGVCDNVQLQLGGGIDLSKQIKLDKLIFSTDLLVAVERIRNDDLNSFPVGVVFKTQIQHRCIGLDLMYYVGDVREVYYDTHFDQIYWGNPIIRTKHYAQSKLFVKLFSNRFVRGEVSVKAHCLGNKVFYEQVFSLSIDLK